jgi:hypothetical protein
MLLLLEGDDKGENIFEEDFVLLIELCSDELVLLRFYI